MIQRLRRARFVDVTEPLPPVWARRAPTQRDVAEWMGRDLCRVGVGKQFRDALVESIDRAEEVVLVVAFLLSDKAIADAMLQAVDRGVRVYVLTASEARLTRELRDDDGFEARMAEEHKKLLDRLAGKVVLRSAEHLHAKFLVTDPTTKPGGWLSTANFNLALLESVEIGIRLRPEEAKELATWFNWVFWKEAEHELVGKGRLSKTHAPPAEPSEPKPGAIVATARDETSLRETTLDLIRSARRRLIVSSYGLEDGHPAVEAIAKRAREGLPVTVLTRPRRAVGAACLALARAGATVLAHDTLHAKIVISDEQALVMTANLQRAGLDEGFEVGLRIRPDLVGAVQATLDSWIATFPWAFEPSLLPKSAPEDLCLVEFGLPKGRKQMRAEVEVDIGEVTAHDALSLNDAPVPPPANGKGEPSFARRRREVWHVAPPRLPRGAREVQQEQRRTERDKGGKQVERVVKVSYDPPVYEHNGKRYVVVSSDEQASDARVLAQAHSASVVTR